MKKIWNWLVTSSADPNKTALTVKGFLNTFAGVALVLSPMFNLNLGKEQIDVVIEAIVQGIIIIYTMISAILGLAGLVRKIVFTFSPNK